MMLSVETHSRRWARGAGPVAAVLLVVAGGAFAVVHATAGDPYGPEGWRQDVALGLPLMATGVIAFLGSVVRRPWLAAIGGAAAVPMCLVSIVGMPAAIPAAVVIAAGVGSLRSVSARDWVTGGAIAALLVGAFGYVVLHQDPADWTTPSGGVVSSSNVITMIESIVVYVAVGLALALAVSHLLATTRLRAPAL
jgi:hypothetical protein